MSPLSNGIAPRMRPLPPRRSALVAALDIGTSKVVCLIARLRPQGPQEVLRRRTHVVEVIGFGHTSASGMKAGTIVDLGSAEEVVRHAVDLAETMAGVQIESVVVSVSAGRLTSHLFEASVDLGGNAVGDHDIGKVLAVGGETIAREGRVVLHSLPIGFTLDETRGIRDPRGMIARRLGVDMHVVCTDPAAVHNLVLAIERCHLDVEAMVASPYAAGLSVLADDEDDLGAAVIDLGAGTTTAAVFSGGRFVHVDSFALGGHHVTMDLARGLSTGVQDAERIKTLYGSVVSGGSDERDMISVHNLGVDEREPPQLISRAVLTRIIKPRVEEILEMVRDRLGRSQFSADPRARVVLTGGACQLTGLPELASRILGRAVRVGRPLGISGLPESAKASAFAAATGLLIYPQAAHLEHFEPRRTRPLLTGTDGYLTRVGRWLRESF